MSICYHLWISSATLNYTSMPGGSTRMWPGGDHLGKILATERDNEERRCIQEGILQRPRQAKEGSGSVLEIYLFSHRPGFDHCLLSYAGCSNQIMYRGLMLQPAMDQCCCVRE